MGCGGFMVSCFKVEGLGLKDFLYKLDFIGRSGECLSCDSHAW